MTQYVAGYLEGFLSASRIQEFRHNANKLMAPDEQRHHALPNIRKSFAKKVRSILDRGAIADGVPLNTHNRPKEDWWLQARFSLIQAIGIRDGFNARRQKVHNFA